MLPEIVILALLIERKLNLFSSGFIKGTGRDLEPSKAQDPRFHMKPHTKFGRKRSRISRDIPCGDLSEVSAFVPVVTLIAETSDKSPHGISRLILDRFRPKFVCGFMWKRGSCALEGSKSRPVPLMDAAH